MSSTERVTHRLGRFPTSVNVLEDVHEDPRTVDKLLDGQNDTDDEAHMWLTPFQDGVCGAQRRMREGSCFHGRRKRLSILLLGQEGSFSYSLSIFADILTTIGLYDLDHV